MIKETLNHVEIDPGKGKSRKRTSREILEVFNNRGSFVAAKSDLQDTLQEIDATVQSPISEHEKMDIDSSKKNKRRRRRMNRKANNRDCLKGTDQTDIFNNRGSSVAAKSDLQEIDSTVQFPIHEYHKIDTDSPRDPATKSVERKRNKRRRKRMNRKANNKHRLKGTDQTDIFNNRGSSIAAKSDLQDNIQVIDSTVQSPIDDHHKMDTDSPIDPASENVERKKNRRRRQKMNRKANKKDRLKGTDQTDILPSVCWLGEQHGQENDNKLNKVKSTVQEFGFSVGEGSKLYHSKEERPRFVKRFLGKIVKSFEGQNVDSTSICDPHLKQVAEKNEKSENAFEQAVGGSFIYGEETLVESQRELKHPSSDAEVTSHVSLVAFDTVNNFLEVVHPSKEIAPVACSRRKLLILDLNGLLADIIYPPPKGFTADINISRRAIFKRPFYYDFLKFCFNRFNVGIWSSRSKKIIGRVVDYLLGDLKHKLIFCWDLSHCTETGLKTLENRHKPLVCKELRKLWEKHDPTLPWEKGSYNESNTLLLDDSPYKALLNPMHTAIFPHSYNFKDANDNSLGPGGDLRVYLEDLAVVENIQKYVEQHPFGQSSINETSSSWEFYSGILRRHFSVPTGSSVFGAKLKKSRRNLGNFKKREASFNYKSLKSRK